MVLARTLSACLLIGLLTGPAPAASAASARLGTAAEPPVERVLAISVDALSSAAVKRLGPEGAPNLHRLLAEGVGTLNARTQVESTETLPNHVSMVTGRRVSPRHQGHGVTWNDHRPRSTVHRAAGHAVASLFTVAHRAGPTALFSSKRKLSILQRSWPSAIDRAVTRDGNDGALVRAVSADLRATGRVLTFVHLTRADVVGHARGFLTPAYYDALRRVDALVGKLLGIVERQSALIGTAVILTADHGATPGESHHGRATSYHNFTIPFVVWGAGVGSGELYAMNPAYADPGRRRVGYAGRQPVRNGDLANLALDLLGLGPVPGSRFDAQQRLQVS